jgi:hypothetical protein
MEQFQNALLLECLFRAWVAPFAGAEKNDFVRRHFVYRLKELMS